MLRNVFLFRQNSPSGPNAMNRIWLAVVCTLLLAFAASPARAITYQWTGRGDGCSWNDPNNWNGLLHLLCPGALPCLDSAIIPAGTNVSIDASVNVYSISMGSGSTLTVECGVVLGFGTITGAGQLVNAGTVTPCGATGTLGSGIDLDDKTGSIWYAGLGQTLRFERSATDLKGDIYASANWSAISLAANVRITTQGQFFFPLCCLPCLPIQGDGGGLFTWTSGPAGPASCAP